MDGGYGWTGPSFLHGWLCRECWDAERVVRIFCWYISLFPFVCSFQIRSNIYNRGVSFMWCNLYWKIQAINMCQSWWPNIDTGSFTVPWQFLALPLLQQGDKAPLSLLLKDESYLRPLAENSSVSPSIVILPLFLFNCRSTWKKQTPLLARHHSDGIFPCFPAKINPRKLAPI